MTTLFQAPGACSLAPLIALHVTGMTHDTVQVDLRAHKLADGSDYYAVNPKGAVPALKVHGGEVLTENAVLLQYIADQAPALRRDETVNPAAKRGIDTSRRSHASGH